MDDAATGQHLARELARRGMTAASLARASGLDQSRLSTIIAGKRSMTAETALVLARVWPEIQAEEWLVYQLEFDLAQARARLEKEVGPACHPAPQQGDSHGGTHGS
jgi:addiction module HigA family antidote